MNSTVNKIEMYIISLWLLFVLIAIKEFQFISWKLSLDIQDICETMSKNGLAFFSICMLILGVWFYVKFAYRLKGSTKLPKVIKKIEDQNYEHLTFLTTYIIPFIRVKLEGRDILITFLLLIIIGAIFVKTNLFYKNPTLALLGYKLYKVDTEASSNLIFISKQKLKVGDRVHHIYFGDNIYFVKT